MLIDRRVFLGLTSGAALGFALGLEARTAPGEHRRGRDAELRILPSVCDHDCGGRCLMQVHVAQGRLRHITTDDGSRSGRGYGYHAEDQFQLRTCVRGRAYRAQVDSPLRILTPLRRGTSTSASCH